MSSGPDAGFDGSAADGEEDGEEEDDVDPAEIQRRKDRLEREQWLREQVGPTFITVLLRTEPGLTRVSQMEQKTRKGEDPDGEDEQIGDEDSRFMKLAKKLTARTLQRKGGSGPARSQVLLVYRIRT